MNSNDAPKQNVIPATQRKDGSLRKEVKVKPGYVNPDEVPKYVIPNKRDEEKAPQTEETAPEQAGENVTNESGDQKKKRVRNKAKKENNPDGANEASEESKSETKGKAAERKDSQKEAADDEKGLSESEKQLRKLKKKLRQIEDLEKKKASGASLNDEEVLKLKTKTDILRQINDLKVK